MKTPKHFVYDSSCAELCFWICFYLCYGPEFFTATGSSDYVDSVFDPWPMKHHLYLFPVTLVSSWGFPVGFLQLGLQLGGSS